MVDCLPNCHRPGGRYDVQLGKGCQSMSGTVISPLFSILSVSSRQICTFRTLSSKFNAADLMTRSRNPPEGLPVPRNHQLSKYSPHSSTLLRLRRSMFAFSNLDSDQPVVDRGLQTLHASHNQSSRDYRQGGSR